MRTRNSPNILLGLRGLNLGGGKEHKQVPGSFVDCFRSINLDAAVPFQ
jgi:hypothetical protein